MKSPVRLSSWLAGRIQNLDTTAFLRATAAFRGFGWDLGDAAFTERD